MLKKLSIILFILIAIAGGFWYFSKNKLEKTEAAANRTGLIGWWNMDTNNINGATVYDKSGFGNDGTMFLGPTTSIGKIKQALNFNNSYIWASDAKLKPTSGITVATWVKFDSLSPANQGLVNRRKVDGVNQGYEMETANNTVALCVYVTGGWKCSPNSNQGLITGVWYHIAGTYDGSNVRTYINGVEFGTGTAASGAITYDATGNLYMGAEEGASRNLFGSMDDVRVYNRALSAQEVTQLYNSAKMTRENSPSRASSTPSAGNRLVGWWTMDSNDINGTTIYDRSGLNNTATSTGTTSANGKIKQAKNFNGSSDYISIADSPSLSFGNGSTDSAFSLSAWVKPNIAGLAYLFGKEPQTIDNDNREWLFLSHSDGKIYFALYSLTGAKRISVTGPNSSLTVGAWHHMVATYDGTKSTNGMKIYVDKIQVNNGTDNLGTYTGMSDTNSHVVIGAGDRQTLFNNGPIDDVRIYNYTLSVQEVANLYSAAKTAHMDAATKTGLVGYWTMNNEDRSGNLMYDKSGFNNNGTITGTTISIGMMKQAKTFNGSGDYINIADNASLDFGTTGSFTLATWFKSSSLGQRRIFSSGHWGFSNGYNLTADCCGDIIMGIGAGGNRGNSTWAGVGGFEDNKWHHVIAVFDRTLNRHTMYIDGTTQTMVKDATTCGTIVGTYLDTSACGSLNATSNEAKAIGRSNTGSAEYWSGSLDDIRAYNRALSAQEATNLYNASKMTHL